MPGICAGEGDQSSPAASPPLPFSVSNARGVLAQPCVGSREGGRVSPHSCRGRGASRTGWKRRPGRPPHRPARCCPASSRSPLVEVWDPPRGDRVSPAVRFPVAEAGLRCGFTEGCSQPLPRAGAASQKRISSQVINLPPPRAPPPAAWPFQLSAVTTGVFFLCQTCHLRAAWETLGPRSDVGVLIFSSTPPSFCNRHDFFKVLLNLQ